MAITIQHGGGLAGVASAYGAMGRAEVEAEAERKRKEAEKKGRRLGNIGSAMQIAGSVLTFTPLAPVGIGLTVAGSGLKQAAGGRGDQGMAIAGTAAAGISSIYAQRKLRQEETAERMEYSKEMADYQNDLYTQRQKEYWDQRSAFELDEKVARYKEAELERNNINKAFDTGTITSPERNGLILSWANKHGRAIEQDSFTPEYMTISNPNKEVDAGISDLQTINKTIDDMRNTDREALSEENKKNFDDRMTVLTREKDRISHVTTAKIEEHSSPEAKEDVARRAMDEVSLLYPMPTKPSIPPPPPEYVNDDLKAAWAKNIQFMENLYKQQMDSWRFRVRERSLQMFLEDRFATTESLVK